MEQREPRSPCFKIGHRYGENRLILFVIGNVVGITMVNQWFLCVGTWGRSDISLKVHVSNTLFLSSYNINEHTAMTYYQLIKQHHAKAIEGYPSSLYNLALVLHDKGLECHIPVALLLQRHCMIISGR